MKIKPKYDKIIGVYTCRKYFNTRYAAVSKTWLRQKIPENVLILVILGDKNAKIPRLEGNRLYLPVDDSYEKLPHRTLAFFKYCLDNFEFNHIVKFDDDIIVWDFKNLLEKIKGDYGGNFWAGRGISNVDYHFDKGVPEFCKVSVPNELIPLKYAIGPAYYVSKKAAKIIVSCKNLPELKLPCAFEDSMVGRIIEDSKEDLEIQDWASYDEITFHLFYKDILNRYNKWRTLFNPLNWMYKISSYFRKKSKSYSKSIDYVKRKFNL